MRPLVLLCLSVACSTDSFTGSDASNDVGSPEAGEAGVSPCANTPAGTLFCDDFESSSTSPGAKWSLTVQGNGTVVLDPKSFVSPTHSALFDVPSGASIGATTLVYAATNAGSLKLSMRGALRIVTIDDSQGIILMAMTYASKVVGSNVTIAVVAYQGMLGAEALYPGSDGGLTDDTISLGDYTTGAWTSVAVDVTPATIGTSFTHISASVNGQTPVQGNSMAPLPLPSDTSRGLAVGVAFTPPLPGRATVEIDDVLLIAPP